MKYRWPTSATRQAFDRAYWFCEDLLLENPRAETAIKELLETLYTHSKPSRRHDAKHLPQLKILILNLIKASKHPDGLLTIPLGAGAYSEMNNVTYRVLVKHHLETLIQMKWLKRHRGYYGSQDRRLTRVRPYKPLREWLKVLYVDPNDLERTAPSRCLFLKDDKKQGIPVPPELQEKAEQLETNTHKINANMEKTFIDLFADAYELEEINEQMSSKALDDSYQANHLDLSSKYLKRIFNNSSLEEGGRFYDGWWQSIPSEHRPLISLNGDFTVEMDYSSIHIHLLYALLQRPCPMDDPYVFGKLKRTHRDQTKQLMMMLINASSEKGALASAEKEGLFDGELPKGIETPEEYVAEIYKNHEPIQQFFSSGYGVKLQYTDSQIAEAVMLSMLPEPCLPVHDSFIVISTKAQKLRRVMNEEFKAVTGVDAKVKATVIEVSEYRKSIIDNLIDDELSGYSGRLYHWRLKYDPRYFIEDGSSDDKPSFSSLDLNKEPPSGVY